MELRHTTQALRRAMPTATSRTPMLHSSFLRHWQSLPAMARTFTSSPIIAAPPRAAPTHHAAPTRSPSIAPNAATTTAPRASSLPAWNALSGSANREQSAKTIELVQELRADFDQYQSTSSGMPTARQVQAAEVSRLRPELGRTVHVAGSVDIGRAFGMLDRLVRYNRIAQDQRAQRFHERPGMKRKRLRSVRWKARFKDAFHTRATRVLELARQGW